MKVIKTPVLLICVLLFVMGTVRASHGRDITVKNYREGEILVKYRSSAGELQRGQVRSLVGAWKTRRYSRIGIEKLYLGTGLSAVEAVELLNSDPNVEYAELNLSVEYLDAPRIEPNDPGFMSGDQWYLDAPLLAGSHVGTEGTVYIDIDIDAPEAWAVMGAVFDPTMTASVGVLDSGCGELGETYPSTGYEPGHADLSNAVLWRNPAEAAGAGNFDDDFNGFKDDINGWDFMDPDNCPADEYDRVAPYHGTHISGIISGLWGNGVGMAGIGREQVKVLPLRTLYSDEIADAIDYAIGTAGTPGVKVLNASWRFTSPQSWLQDAIAAAEAAGITFVASAGNDGNNNDTNTGIFRVYPAEYSKVPLENVLAVAATGRDGSLVTFSNFGPDSVQIAAPGVDIYSPSGGSSGYTYVSGTSFSAPIAASALALVMSANPALSPAEAIDRVVDGGEFDARLSGLIRSGKRINLAGALAPFAPYSGPVPMDTLVPISIYTDSVSSLYGSISSAISDSPSVAVMKTTSGGAWAVSPISPGLTTFNLGFDAVSAPVGTYDTGLWRVTAIAPFSAHLNPGEELDFASLIPGNTVWSVTDPTVGDIDNNGHFRALSHGTTRVVLNVDGQDVDNSGNILVIAQDNDGDDYRENVDCDDTDPSINPGENEICSDGIDNDCDGFIDGYDTECKSSNSGGCGTTALPQGEPLWPAMLVLLGLVVVLIRRKSLAAKRSNV